MEKLLKRIWLWFLIIGSGTIIDWIVHNMRDEFHVPFSYFPNKIIFGVLWGVVFTYLLQGLEVLGSKRVFILPFLVAVVLQTKYFFEGYDMFFVVLFLFLHFLMFLPMSAYIFKNYEKDLS